MSTDRVTKSLLTVIAGLLGVIALRSGSIPETTTVLAQPAPPAGVPAGRVQVTGTPNGFVVFDESTGDVMRATTTAADGVGMGRVGNLRRNDRGQWEFTPEAGVAAPAAPKAGDPADPAAPAKTTLVTKAQADLATLVTALAAFRLDTGRYPSTEEGLHSLVVQPSAVENWKGPYVKPTLPMDPWGNPYVYHFPGRADPKRPDLASFGPDRKEGGGDDLLGTSAPVK